MLIVRQCRLVGGRVVDCRHIWGFKGRQGVIEAIRDTFARVHSITNCKVLDLGGGGGLDLLHGAVELGGILA